MRAKSKQVIIGGLFIFLIFFAVTVYANLAVLKYSNNIHNFAETAPSAETALIFGGGMNKDGTMSQMQYDRVLAGVELYSKGNVKKLLMTGDDGQNHTDEVSFMKKLAIEQSVPESAINIDPHGYRTYESCYRASRVYGVTTTIAVSQSFHLPRIRYFCERMGIQTIGAAADLRDYDAVWVPYFREYLARVKGWWQMEVTKPKPYVYKP